MDEYTQDIADSVETTKSKIVSAFNNILRQRLADCIDQRKKLRTYATFKTDIRFENYLDFVLKFKVRRCYSQFCLGVHDLEIERGCYRPRPLPIAERLCTLCSLQAVEDEKHFLVECPLYMKQRKRLYKKLADMHYDINEMEGSEKFIWLLMQENNNCIHWIGNYIYSAMKTRKKVSEDTT